MYSNLRNFKLIAILILSSHDLFISSMVAEAMFTFAKLSTGAAKDIALVKKQIRLGHTGIVDPSVWFFNTRFFKTR